MSSAETYVRALTRTIQLGLDPTPAAAVAILAAGVFLPVAPARVIVGTVPVIPELDRLWNRNQRISLQFENVSAATVLATQIGLRYRVVNSDSLRVWLPEPQLPTGDATMPVIVNRVEPVYPKDARLARVGRKVILQAVIREDGTVGDVEILTHTEGWPSLDEAAIAAVRQRTCSPAMKDERPVSSYFTIRVDFTIN